MTLWQATILVLTGSKAHFLVVRWCEVVELPSAYIVQLLTLWSIVEVLIENYQDSVRVRPSEPS